MSVGRRQDSNLEGRSCASSLLGTRSCSRRFEPVTPQFFFLCRGMRLIPNRNGCSPLLSPWSQKRPAARFFNAKVLSNGSPPANRSATVPSAVAVVPDDYCLSRWVRRVVERVADGILSRRPARRHWAAPRLRRSFFSNRQARVLRLIHRGLEPALCSCRAAASSYTLCACCVLKPREIRTPARR